MAWRYQQSSGVLSLNGTAVSKGYSGGGRGRNDPAMQGVKGIGPIPRGRWRMTAVNDSRNTGPFTITLEPEPGTDALGRSEFRVHGDSVTRPGTASRGCIILPRAIRDRLWAAADHVIEVVA